MIVFENVSKTYTCKSLPDKHALTNVSFSLPEKGMVFILGKSGSGKTTVLNLLGGIDRVSGGQIKFNNRNLAGLDNKELNSYRANYIGFVFQEFFLLDNQSVKANLMLSGQILHGKYTNETVGEVLARVDLAGYENKKCSLLSSGEKQRVSIARSLIKDSKILLADEPTGSLDSENGEKIFNLLKNISESRLVVVVSHDLEAAEKYADHVITLKDGKVLEQSEPLNADNQVEDTLEKEFEFQKVNGLKTRDVFISAFGNIRKTAFRTILSFSICLIGFLVFFIANVIATVDAPNRLLSGLIDNHINNGQIHIKWEDLNSSKPNFSVSDVNEIISKNPSIEFLKINRDYGGLFGMECDGVAEISSSRLSAQQFVYGNAPTTTEEFFVTDLYAERLLDQLNWKPEFTDMNSLIGYNVDLRGHNLKLTGIVKSFDLQNYYVYFPEGFFDTIKDAYLIDNIDGYCSYLYFDLSDNYKANYNFFKAYHGDDLLHKTNSKFYITTSLSDAFYSTMANYFAMSKWFYGISMVFMLFVVLICFNIISVAIKKNQRENGIKRALGYSNFDLFKIYILQMAIPFVLIIPFVVVIGYVVIRELNKMLMSELAVLFGLFSISAANVILLILLCAATVMIGTIIPMIRLFKSQPIDIIRT